MKSDTGLVYTTRFKVVVMELVTKSTTLLLKAYPQVDALSIGIAVLATQDQTLFTTSWTTLTTSKLFSISITENILTILFPLAA